MEKKIKLKKIGEKKNSEVQFEKIQSKNTLNEVHNQTAFCKEM